MEDCLDVGYVVQHTKIGDIPTLAVARRLLGNKSRIINAFTDGEALALYNRLTDVDGVIGVGSNDLVMDDRLTIGFVAPEGKDVSTFAVGRVVNKSIRIVSLFTGAEAIEMYTLLTAVTDEEEPELLTPKIELWEVI